MVGIEINEEAAKEAGHELDLVYCNRVEEVIDGIDEEFDLIFCGDVLEHLVDPWRIVRSLAALAAPAGHLAVSIPNIRYYRAIARIAIGQGFRYDDSGIFDATHLRFFTRRNVDVMLRNNGWLPVRWGGPVVSRLQSLTQRLHLGFLDEWLMYQWYVLAVRDGTTR